MDMEKETFSQDELEEILQEFSAESGELPAVEETEDFLFSEKEENEPAQEAAVPEPDMPEPVKTAPKPRKKWILPAAAAAVVLVAAVIFVLTQFVFAAGGMYSVRAEALDLRNEELTVEDYQELAEKLPQCDITWNVPFQGGVVDSSAKEITLTALTEEDILLLDYVTGLETVHAEACDDYALLAQLQQHCPNVSVLYAVPISGERYAQDTQILELAALTAEDAALLPTLLHLNQVSVTGCEDYAMLQQLQAEYPQWNLTYDVLLGGEWFPWDSREVQATNVSADELMRAVSGLPMLKKLDLVNPLVPYADLAALREQNNGLKLNWTVELFDQIFTEETTEIDISGNLVENCESVEQLVACLPNLKKLIMSDCGIDSETMSQFRERQRENYKVVWTVYIGEICRVRTDEIFFHPIQQGEYYMWDEDTPELKYCEDMICLDIGHHKIRNIDFCRYMPELKYLILAHTLIRDVSALVGCQKLIFLEVNWSELRDYSPLVELKALEDLNLHRTYADITPLLEMTWLKNLWVPGRSYQEKMQLIAALPNTNLELYSDNTRGWRHLPNYYDMRDLLGMRYMTQ